MTAHKPIGLGFIGCGQHALRSHAEVVVGYPEDFSIEAVYDVSPEAMDKFVALAPQAYKTASAEDLIDFPKVEAVVIATPPAYHLELLEKAVAAGKHVFCEKPLWVGDNDRQGEEIIRQAFDQKLVLTSCHPRRFDQLYQITSDRFTSYRDKFGPLLSFNFRFFYHKTASPWRLTDSLLLDHFNHEIDLFCFMMSRRRLNLQKIWDSHDRYEVSGFTYLGERKVSLCFSGSRKLQQKIYRNELELIFGRGRVRAVAELWGDSGVVRNFIAEQDFQHSPTDEIVSSVWFEAAWRSFKQVMFNFAGAIRGTEINYLVPEDLIQNTVVGNTLVKDGFYKN